jgi:hypothetical protein
MFAGDSPEEFVCDTVLSDPENTVWDGVLLAAHHVLRIAHLTAQ